VKSCSLCFAFMSCLPGMQSYCRAPAATIAQSA
jgi:hypothetical protein